MWRAQLGEEHAYELSDWEKSFSGEPQSEYNAARYFGCKDDRRHTAYFPRHAWNSAEKVSLFELSQRIVEAAKRKRSSQESPKALCPKWTCISPFCLFSLLTSQLIDGSIPLTYLSREVIHTAVALAQQNEAQILIALHKCDLMKPASLIQERKKLIVDEIPSLLRPSVFLFFTQVTRRWESKTTGPRL